MKGWRTYGRIDDRLITKISWTHGQSNFLTYGASLAAHALRTPELSYSILLPPPPTGRLLTPFPLPKRLYGRTSVRSRECQNFLDGWITKFSQVIAVL